MSKVLVICGATASGKTALSVACAKKLNTEIISADSLLIYKGLDIGTAKPNKQEQGGVEHHLIDVLSPFENFSVSDYEKKALPILQKLIQEGKTPIICGGTGFYINALLYQSQFGGAGANETIRQKYQTIYEEKGKDYLHALLTEKDPESAKILHENDVKRVIRALEIYDITGKPKSAQADKRIPRFDFVAFLIDYPREVLYQRINQRVEEMFENGLLEEVQSLIHQGLTEKNQCMQGIGYKEILEGLRLGWDVEQIKEAIKKNTRNYAKRQITFFKRLQNLVTLSPKEATADKVLSLLK